MSMRRLRSGLLSFPVDAGFESSVTFLDEGAGDGTGSTAESVTLDLGTATAGDKIVIIITAFRWAGTASTASTVQFDGTTSLTDSNVVASNAFENIEIWYYDDSGGSIGGSTSIDVTWANAMAISSLSAYRLRDVFTGGPETSASDASTDPPALSVNVAQNAIIVAGAYQRDNDDNTIAWTGPTADFDDHDGSYNSSSASLKEPTGATPKTIEPQWSTAGVRSPLGVSATWNQAAIQVEYISAEAVAETSSSSGTFSATVPADCDCAVIVAVGTEDNTSDIWPTSGVSINSVDATKTAAHYSGDAAGSFNSGGCMWVLANPATGSQTLAYALTNLSGGLDYGAKWYVAYFKNVDQTSPVGDTDVEANSGSSNGSSPLSVTSGDNDMTVYLRTGYPSGSYDDDFSGTEIVSDDYDSCIMHLSYALGEDSPGMSGTSTFSGHMAIVLTAAT